MMAMMLGLVPFGWLYLVQRVFYAYEDAKTPFLLQVVVTVVATAVNLVALTVDPGRTGVVVGIGQTVSNLAAALVGFMLLRRRLGLLRLGSSIRTYVRLALAGVLAAGGDGLHGAPDSRVWASTASSWSGAFTELALGGVVFVVVCFGTAHLLRVDEVGQLFDPVLRRLRRRPS